MKNLLTHKPVLAYYDVTLKTKVSTDACKNSLGALLLQMHGNYWKPVAYAARSMTSAEKNYAPGKYLCIADTLSRCTFKQKCVTDNFELSAFIDAQVNMVISSFPATDKQLVKFANETKNDPMLHAVMNGILYGWKNGQCPAYASFKDKLCIINGIIFRGSRIVVPASMRN